MRSAASKSGRDSGLTEAIRHETVPEICPLRHRYKSVAVLLVALAAFVVLQFLLPLRTAVQIGADEGFELAKATPCLKGYQLYTEVWNDQPPLHTFLITHHQRNFAFAGDSHHLAEKPRECDFGQRHLQVSTRTRGESGGHLWGVRQKSS